MKKIIQMSDMSNAQKLDFILNSRTPERSSNLPNLNRTIDVGKSKKDNEKTAGKANIMSEYMNRFNKSAER